jgi:hypothetical protein
MSATLTPGAVQVPDSALPAGIVSAAADLLEDFGYSPKFAAAQRRDRDIWGPAAALLRTRAALRPVASA